MDKKQLVEYLEEMAVLLDLKGENPFKVRAYANAARILQGYSGDIFKIIQNNEITKIKGIGKGIADFLSEVIETEKSKEAENLKKEIPKGLLEMLKIQGMGPKKVRAVWKLLNITNIGELEYACQENRLIDLEGFGKKTQDKILIGIEFLKKYSERHLISKAREEADNLYNELKNLPAVIQIEIAGSLRRWKETIKDIDLLVGATDSDREKIMDFFTHLSNVEDVSGKGLTKSSIILKSGINADLRIVEDHQFPYALHHFTGSKEHNVAMREYARKLKLKMNEYGLFKANEENIPCKDERDIFSHLNMAYIPPELRENYGEIEAALNDEIPVLVNQEEIKGIVHVHSNYSDGVNSIEELAYFCQKNGYRYLVICDHSQSAAYANGLTINQITEQHREINDINSNMDNFRVLKSIECDILSDGTLDYDNKLLATFDLVIASIHSGFKMSEEEATKRVIRAIENPYVTILGHPTGRLLLAREGYPIDMNAVIDAASELNVAIELNANPHRLDIDWRLLKLAKLKRVKISINPDAHRLEGIKDIEYGIGIARKGWLTQSDVLNCLTSDELIQFAKIRQTN